MADKTPTDFELLVKAMLAKRKAEKAQGPQKRAKIRAQSERQERLYRVNDSKWVNEAYVMLVTDTHCKCDNTWTSPAPHVFLQRYHPKHGKHLEAICVRPSVSGIPFEIETRHIECEVCPSCFVRDCDEPAQQTCFDFTNIYYLNAALSKPQEPTS